MLIRTRPRAGAMRTRLFENRPISDYADVFWHGEQCYWPKCLRNAQWDVSPYRDDSGVQSMGSYCTRHTRAVLRQIEKQADKDEV